MLWVPADSMPPMQSFLEYLRGLTADVQCVQGDFDEFASPEQQVHGRACRAQPCVHGAGRPHVWLVAPHASVCVR